jgi:hypothetical protein
MVQAVVRVSSITLEGRPALMAVKMAQTPERHTVITQVIFPLKGDERG